MKRIAFVASGHRSGSTLLNLILGSHDKAVDVGEFGTLLKHAAHPDGSRCTCGASPFTACEFWTDVVARVEADVSWNPFQDPSRHRVTLGGDGVPVRVWMYLIRRLYGEGGPGARHLLRLIGGERVIADMVHSTFALYDAILAAADAALLVDSQKEPVRIKALLNHRPEMCRILYLVRDGRGVMASHLNTPMGKARWHRNPEDAVRRWMAENRAVQRILRTLPQSTWMQVRYEDICRDPEAEFTRICAFLDLDFDPGMLSFGEKTHHTVGGNRMRFGGKTEIRLDEKWRTLDPEHLDAFTRVGGEMNRALGFAD